MDFQEESQSMLSDIEVALLNGELGSKEELIKRIKEELADYAKKKMLQPAIPQGRRCETIEVGFEKDKLASWEETKGSFEKDKKLTSWEETKGCGAGKSPHKKESPSTSISNAMRMFARSKWPG